MLHHFVLLIFLVYLPMPYYRIVIYTKKRKEPFAGIRHIENANINAVYNLMQSKASSTYRQDLIEVEVQMLSKLCKAVQEYVNR
jgi:hypothetical protein